MKDVSDKTKEHLSKVYFNLMICSGICALAMYINAYTILMTGFFSQILVFIGLGYLMYKISDKSQKEETRLGYLWALAFAMGYLVGPVMHLVAEIDQMILVNAVVYTAIMFGSFTAISLFSKRRSYLFLGGVIFSLSSAMFWYSLTSWLVGSGFKTDSLLYIMTGLLMACLYIIYDTQIIIERAERGDKNVPEHTMTLFIDLFDMFIRNV